MPDVVMAAAGYPGSYKKGAPIGGLGFAAVDAALGRTRPAAVEYIVASAVYGSEAVPMPRRLLGNPCGHAFVAYRLPSSPDCEGIEYIAPELRGILLNACHTEGIAIDIVTSLPHLSIVCWRSQPSIPSSSALAMSC